MVDTRVPSADGRKHRSVSSVVRQTDPVPTAPLHRFASDNNAGVHPVVLDAIARANAGHATAYGDDEWTKRANGLFDELFGRPVDTYMVWGGTGANVLALATMLSPPARWCAPTRRTSTSTKPAHPNECSARS